MIEIVPCSDFLRGSNLPLAVDEVAYSYIYNEVFIEEWNQYIKKIKAGSDFIKSKWFIEEHKKDAFFDADAFLETLSQAEKIKLGRKFSEGCERRLGKKGQYFQKLVNDFDRERNLITCYNSKFYTYETGKFADYIIVYLIQESEITNILNYLYLRINKTTNILNYLYLRIKEGNRVFRREELFSNFKVEIDDDEDYED